MFRAIVKNLSGEQINCYIEMERLSDLNQYLHQIEQLNLWGLPERTKWVDECAQEELDSALKIEEVLVSEAVMGDPEADPPIPNQPAVFKEQATLPATYTVEVVDITEEVETENTRKQQVKNLKQRVKQLASQNDLTAAELKECVMKLVKVFALNRDLD